MPIYTRYIYLSPGGDINFNAYKNPELHNLVALSSYSVDESGNFRYADSTVYIYKGNHSGDLIHQPLEADYIYHYNSDSDLVGVDTQITYFNIMGRLDSINTGNTTTTYFSYDSANSFLAYYEYATLRGIWQLYDSTFYLYNHAHKLINATTGYINSSYSFTNYDKHDYYYDTTGDLITEIYSTWNNISSIWDSNAITSYTYDTAHNLLSEVSASYDMGTWDSGNKYVYTYDHLNQMTSMQSYTYSNGPKIWEGDVAYNFTYDHRRLATAQAFEFSLDSMKWFMGLNYYYLYDASGNLDTIYTKVWIDTSYTWANHDRTIYQYDSHYNLINTLYQYGYINAPGFVSYRRALYSYNNHNQLTLYETNSAYDSRTGSWGLVSCISGCSTPPYCDVSYRYYYNDSITSIAKNHNVDNTLLLLYPSPANNLIILKKHFEHTEPFTVSILDMSGRILMQWHEISVTNYSRTVMVSMLPTGNYILSLYSRAERDVQKFSVTH